MWCRVAWISVLVLPHKSFLLKYFALSSNLESTLWVTWSTSHTRIFHLEPSAPTTHQTLRADLVRNSPSTHQNWNSWVSSKAHWLKQLASNLSSEAKKQPPLARQYLTTITIKMIDLNSAEPSSPGASLRALYTASFGIETTEASNAWPYSTRNASQSHSRGSP